MLNVWAREGSPQSPQLCAPTAQVQALPVTPLSSSCKLQKNDAFAVRPQCFVVSHTPKHSIRCGTVQGTTSAAHLHLCSAQITYKCSLCPAPSPQHTFFPWQVLFGPSHLQITSVNSSARIRLDVC